VCFVSYFESGLLGSFRHPEQASLRAESKDQREAIRSSVSLYRRHPELKLVATR